MRSIELNKTIHVERALDIFAKDVKLQKMLQNLYTDEGKEEMPNDWDVINTTFSELFEKRQGFVAFYKEEDPVGYSLWMETPDSVWVPDSIFISELYVNTRFRKHGIGSLLVQNILELQFPENVKKLWVTHDPKHKYLTGFYQRLGLVTSGVTDVGNVIMTRDV